LLLDHAAAAALPAVKEGEGSLEIQR